MHRWGCSARTLCVPLLILLLMTLVICLNFMRFVQGSFRGVHSAKVQPYEERRWEQQTPLEAAFAVKTQSILSGGRLVGEELDVHLFVLWHRAYPQRLVILKDIRESFLVLDLAEFDWGDITMGSNRFLSNLWVLYNGKGGWKREGMWRKVQQCGYGKFIALVVADMHPRYVQKPTAHGPDTVNLMMHIKKELYRKWTGGGFKVHGTFSTHEANHDIRVLFHTTVEGVLERAMEKRAYPRDVVSAFLDDPAFFATTREAYGVTDVNSKDNNDKTEGKVEQSRQQGWRCASFLFALGSLTQVTVADGRTGVLLWSKRSSPSGTPLAVEVVTHVACAAWPDTLELRAPLSEMWGAVALLRASPVNLVGVTLRSAFAVELEGSTRVLHLKSFS
ncbi:hypothetical protein TraAM80_08898 [Trypanosoma rangeli]|uniref:Uncharacterized protein n=1 Tax=Trypanosoma rangeli TaxID=5698 RepID=A0A3R7LJ39_TRYRA|nr:uncharacterized protein TraAM80_08898 [Trypanosoma rangeli]RNE98247.1 hypothetical protein TraAM80_08898 [Trypanosoma rangeli]|eukprot:RNE98247.1 hypothetical protein TraAM80_08898 [Trypanosoma rangeli]